MIENPIKSTERLNRQQYQRDGQRNNNQGEQNHVEEVEESTNEDDGHFLEETVDEAADAFINNLEELEPEFYEESSSSNNSQSSDWKESVVSIG